MNDGFPKIKICGISDQHFAKKAESFGADYLGFIFAEGSPRRVSPETAAQIASALSGSARRVGVFTKSAIPEMLEIASIASLDVIQLHSADYGADEIRELHMAGFEVWQLYGQNTTMPMHAMIRDGDNLADVRMKTSSVGCFPDAILLDGVSGGATGGTGALADWQLAKSMASSGIRVVLAGGISADNAVEAAKTGCAVLDVNSSLETSKAVKSTVLLERFFDAIR